MHGAAAACAAIVHGHRLQDGQQARSTASAALLPSGRPTHLLHSSSCLQGIYCLGKRAAWKQCSHGGRGAGKACQPVGEHKFSTRCIRYIRICRAACGALQPWTGRQQDATIGQGLTKQLGM